MFLEALKNSEIDFVVYSENQFSLENNFRILNNSDGFLKPETIIYPEVCTLLKMPGSKNLIVYRILTNFKNVDSYSTKYGFFICIEKKYELIYFDPVFAINDLPHLIPEMNSTEFRFKIQQVGLTSSSVFNSEANYESYYAFDLHAAEAKNQNDKIFAEALCIGGLQTPDILNDDLPVQEFSNKTYNQNIDLKQEKITEEKDNLLFDFSKISVKKNIADDFRGGKISAVKNEPRNLFTNKNSEIINQPDILSLFKSTGKSISAMKNNESVILKFNDGD